MLTIVMMIISFFLSKKKGASTGAALGIAAGVGAATWFLADPSNPNSKWGDTTAKWFGMDRKRVTETAAQSTAGNLLGKSIDTVGDVAKAWGPAGVTGAAVGISHGARSSRG